MEIGRIIGATRNLGAPPNWDPEQHGACAHLPIRDELSPAGPCMVSAWMPSPDEIERIVAGAPIYLTVFGTAHPVVGMSIGEPPTEDGT